MLGIHAYWSKPTLTGTTGHHLDKKEVFEMFDFEIVHFLLSALFYRKLNGPIHLYTDKVFFDYLKNKNLLHFWDKVDTEAYSKFAHHKVNSNRNWTSFKTWLLGEISAPFLLIDHDNIIYTEIPKELFNMPVRFAHMETLNRYFYPDKERMDVNNFEYNESWNWNLDVANTCMLYFKTDEFKKEYAQKAIEFEKNNNTDDPYLAEVQYLFADQRLPVMMLEEKNIDYGVFSNWKFTPIDKDIPDWKKVTGDPLLELVGFDHTWAYKHTLKKNPEAHKEYMDRHFEMMNDNFPEYKKDFNQFFYGK